MIRNHEVGDVDRIGATAFHPASDAFRPAGDAFRPAAKGRRYHKIGEHDFI